MNLLHDVRFGMRLLLKHPGFTAVAVTTLALGIAATTAIFSVIYGTYLAPLPYRDADRLVMVWSQFSGRRQPVSPREFVAWKTGASVFEDLQAWGGSQMNLATRERPQLISLSPAAPGFLPMLGYGHPLALGRDFLDGEGVKGRNQVAIITSRLWREYFAGEPGIIGRQIRLDDELYTVVGVLGAGPADQNETQVYLPLTVDPESPMASEHWLNVMGRLKAGVSLEQANANMAAVQAHLPFRDGDADRRTVSVEPFRNNFVRDRVKTALWLLVGAVAFVLLIACANVANLLLARGTARSRELAVRASMGASRGRIIRQLVVESLVLAGAGGLLGAALASGLLAAIVRLLPPYTLPTETEITLSLPVLFFALTACLVSGVLAGCAPAWQAARADVIGALKQGGRSGAGGGSDRLRRGLVALEFALALTLLAAGGLLMRSFFHMTNADLGFEPDGLLTAVLRLPQDRLKTPAELTAFYRRIEERVQAVPGVEAMALSDGLPVRMNNGIMFHLSDEPAPEGRWPISGFNSVTPSYMRTFRIRLVRGRSFDERDREGSVPVAIVNERFVNGALGGRDPLTTKLVIRAFGPDRAERELQIVGVAADSRNAGPHGDDFPEIIVPFWQRPLPRVALTVRSAADLGAIDRSVAEAVRAVDPDLPLASVKTMRQLVGELLADDRFNTVLFGSFAAAALLLASLGIYGVMSFVVAQRTHDIGLRMALGASRSAVLREVLRDGLVTAAVGIAVGTIGAYFAVRAMQGLVYGVDAMDPAGFALVATVLVAAAVTACLVPARRAASVDPMVALRDE